MIEVRRVRAEDWRSLRETRLRALADAPEAFGTTREDEARRFNERCGFVDTGRTEPLRPGSDLVMRELRLAR